MSKTIKLFISTVFAITSSIVFQVNAQEEEATPENNIVCFAAQKQWVCAPAAEQQQAQAKAMRLLETTEEEANGVGDEDRRSQPTVGSQDNRSGADVVVRPMDNPGSGIEPIATRAQNPEETVNTAETTASGPVVQTEPVQAEPVQTTPEPVVETTPTQVVEVAPDVPVVHSSAGTQSFVDWQRQHPQSWSWQVIGTTNRHKLSEFIETSGIAHLPHSIVKTQANGADWWVVLAGLYPSREVALSNREELPAAVAGSAWVRQVQTINGQAD